MLSKFVDLNSFAFKFTILVSIVFTSGKDVTFEDMLDVSTLSGPAPKNSAVSFAFKRPNVNVSVALPKPAAVLSHHDNSSSGAVSNISSAFAKPLTTSYAVITGNNHGSFDTTPFAPVFASCVAFLTLFFILLPLLVSFFTTLEVAAVAAVAVAVAAVAELPVPVLDYASLLNN